jgi:hypothetical protein
MPLQPNAEFPLQGRLPAACGRRHGGLDAVASTLAGAPLPRAARRRGIFHDAGVEARYQLTET